MENLTNTVISNEEYWNKVKDLKFSRIYENKLLSNATMIELTTDTKGLVFKIHYHDGLTESTYPNGDYIITLLKWYNENRNSLYNN